MVAADDLEHRIQMIMPIEGDFKKQIGPEYLQQITERISALNELIIRSNNFLDAVGYQTLSAKCITLKWRELQIYKLAIRMKQIEREFFKIRSCCKSAETAMAAVEAAKKSSNVQLKKQTRADAIAKVKSAEDQLDKYLQMVQQQLQAVTSFRDECPHCLQQPIDKLCSILDQQGQILAIPNPELQKAIDDLQIQPDYAQPQFADSLAPSLFILVTAGLVTKIN